MLQIQTIIHKMEEGGGLRYLKPVLITLALLIFILSYNLRGFKNMSNPEAMDAAQVARNLAEHKGYTTLFVRPFSMFLLQRAYADKHGPPPVGDITDRALIRDNPHPDLANPPLYPVLLAGVMKTSAAFRYQPVGATTVSAGGKPLNIWNFGGGFWIYPPDFWISLFNQILFLASVLMVFFLARRLFDPMVAWTSACVFLGTDLFWRFSMSGLSTILAVFLFTVLAWCLTVLEQTNREVKLSPARLVLLAGVIGALLGMECLTRYSLGWLLIPVLVFLFLFTGTNRVVFCFTATVVFAAFVTPWVLRNYHVSHTFFGTAGYSIIETTSYFHDDQLLRSLQPDLSRVRYYHIWNKFIANTQTILQDDLPRLGGNWVIAFFLVGLLLNFKNATINRLRYFLLLCLPALIAAQALIRTQISEDVPVVNSENLLILLTPLIIIFGVSLFYIMLDQMALPIPQMRYLIIGPFLLLICLPAVLNLFAARTPAVAYPPYYPPAIQKFSSWMKGDELIMSDIPWAVAWYGQRQSVWLTLDTQTDFFSINDYQKPIKALYLSPVTMDSRFLSQQVRAGDKSWGNFVLNSTSKDELPQYFPLKRGPIGFRPDQLFLTDTERWLQPPATAAAPAK